MPALEWSTEEQSDGGPGLPMKIKVDGETGGAWLLYDSGIYGPALGWMPNTEGVLNFMVRMGAVTHTVLITQEAFDELTDTSKWGHLMVLHGKP